VTGEHETLRGGTKTDSKNLANDPKNLISKLVAAFGDPRPSEGSVIHRECGSDREHREGIRGERIHRAIEARSAIVRGTILAPMECSRSCVS